MSNKSRQSDIAYFERGCTPLLLSFAEPYRTDLQLLQKDFEKALLPWWQELEPKYTEFNDNFTFSLLPVFSLALDDYLGIKRDASMVMANVVRLFYFGHHLHELVPDENEDSYHEAEVEFSILAGDYILGKVLHLLTEADLEMLLGIFSEMMAEMNEGMVLKYYFQPSCIDMLIRSRMPLYASMGLSAATVAKQPEPRKLLFRDLCFHYGMAAELVNHNGFPDEAHRHLSKCEAIFAEINYSSSFTNTALEKAICDLRIFQADQNERTATQ